MVQNDTKMIAMANNKNCTQSINAAKLKVFKLTFKYTNNLFSNILNRISSTGRLLVEFC